MEITLCSCTISSIRPTLLSSAIWKRRRCWVRHRCHALPSELFATSEEEQTHFISIVTCPAPQAAGVRAFGDERKLRSTLKERIRRILTVMANRGHNAVVLGAFGCGAFMNDPHMVGALFKQWLDDEFRGYFKKVIFAIYGSEDSPNIAAFKKILL